VGKGTENLAVLRHIALNLLQQDRSAKQRMKQKRFRAALDPTSLLRLLAGPTPATGSEPVRKRDGNTDMGIQI
jgi:hypothetical protein